MKRTAVKKDTAKAACSKKTANTTKTISYRLQCAKTANGLSHFVMYGDADKKQALL